MMCRRGETSLLVDMLSQTLSGLLVEFPNLRGSYVLLQRHQEEDCSEHASAAQPGPEE